MAILWPTGMTNQSRPIAKLFYFYVLAQFWWNWVCGLLLPCYSPASFMLLLCSYSTPRRLQLLPCPCCTPALLLSSSYPAHSELLPSSCLAPFFLPSSALLCSALLLPYSCLAPAPLLLSISPAPTLLLVLLTTVWQTSSSSSAPYDFFRHGESRLLW